VYENFENIILFSKLRLDTNLTRPKRASYDLISIQYIGIFTNCKIILDLVNSAPKRNFIGRVFSNAREIRVHKSDRLLL